MKRTVSLVLVLALAMACRRQAPQSPAPPLGNTTTASSTVGPRPPSEQAKQLYLTRCAVCHGNSGGGDGPAAASFDPKPKDHRLQSWQASMTDDDIRTIIVGGGPAVGKSAAMPASPDLKDQPDLLDDVVALIRSFGA